MRKILVFILAIVIGTQGVFAFSLFGNKSKKTSPSALEGKGYAGTLPNVTKKFTTTEPSDAKPTYEKTDTFHSSNEIKPVPRDNPAFVNIILKSDKTSQYINDINEFLPVVEKVYNSIENGEDVQRFVACVFFLNQNADYLREKYEGKPESNYVSFRKMLELSFHAKAVSALRAEAVRYNSYLAYSGAGYIYDPNNIS